MFQEKQNKKSILQANTPRKQKLSLLLIQNTVHHRIQLRSLESLYKLSISPNKPAIVLIQNFNVLKQIMTNSQFLQMLMNIQILLSLTLIIPGYGIFSQANQIQYIKKFVNLVDNNLGINKFLKSLVFSFPGWRTIDYRFIQHTMSLINSCHGLKQLTLNLANTINLQDVDQKNIDLYDQRSFCMETFKYLMKKLANILTRQDGQCIIQQLQLKFSGWLGLTNEALQILINFLQEAKTNQSLKRLTLDLNTWGISSQLKQQSIDNLHGQIQSFLSLQDLHLDLRNWSNKYKISHFKEITHKQRRKNNGMSETLGGSNGFGITGSLFTQTKNGLTKNLHVNVLM